MRTRHSLGVIIVILFVVELGAFSLCLACGTSGYIFPSIRRLKSS